MRPRSLRLETLEDRALLTGYVYPYGAMPDDTGEYMLGDVAVNVVLMESDPTLAPYDNNPTNAPLHPGHGLPVEDWTASGIAAVKANVEAGLQWWKDTLVQMFPNAPGNLLNFHANYQYADNPVHTGYEPIARMSNDFAGDSLSVSGGQGWIYDFLNLVHFDATGNFSSDIRAYNDFTRQQANTDWAFTIFVVNNANDSDGFAPGGSFTNAFSFAGGRFMVVPATRPSATWAHETGHQFWALDEYAGGGDYNSRRGYYNTQNLNAANNPAPGFVQADSIMSNGLSMSNSYNNHSLDPYTMATIGWQDSDNDGIFDVLDVPFSLSGSGQYNATTGLYKFTGSTAVSTLPNRNSSGTQDDITINQINVVQASIDEGPWQTVQTFTARTYSTNLDLTIPVGGSGSHTIRIRSADLRTGVTSNEFFGETDAPTSGGGGVSGMVFSDQNGDGSWDSGEPPLADVGIEVTDESDNPLSLMHAVEPSEWSQNQILNSIEPGATLSAVGSAVGGGDVYARTSTIAPSAGKVFTANSIVGGALATWNQSQQLRVDFDSPVSTVSLRAYGGSGSSFGRLEAYNSSNQLVARFTTGALGTGSFTTMTVSRAQGDIDHVLAYGHLGTSVVLDTLQWGPAASSTTNTFGAYSLGYLPDGTYHIYVSPPAGYFVSTPTGGYAVVSVSGGQSAGSVNFGIAREGGHHPFYNVSNPYNVNNDTSVAPIDALLVINYINAHGAGEGEISTTYDPASIGYIDVNDDGVCAPIDALLVINYINAHPFGGGGGGGEGEPAAAAPGSFGGTSGGGQGEGEGEVQVPRNAAEYYAQQPLHLLNIRGTDQPCTCAACMTARAAVDQAMQLPAPAAPALTAAENMELFVDLASAGSGAKTSLTTLTSSSLLASSAASMSAQVRGSLAHTARKPADPTNRLAPKLEETLDDIAADISKNERADSSSFIEPS